MSNKTGLALLKRFLSALLTLFLLISLLFIIVRISPGDPTQKYLSAELSPEIAKRVAESFNLHEPVLTQYLSFVKNLFTGNFGISYNYRLPVMDVMWEFLLFTILFGSLSFVIQIITSVYLSLLVSKRKRLNKIVSSFSLLFYSVPAFVLGVFLIYLFSVQFNLFPLSGIKSLDYESFNFFEKFLDLASHLFLPLITLSLAGTAMFYRYLKENLEDVYYQPFILQLRANGMAEKQILKKHIMPNALRPLISIAGIELGILFSGALITEVIFSLPGMGRLTIESIFTRDYPLVIGCTFTAGVLMIVTNFAADLLKFKIDKRLTSGSLS